MDKPIPLPPVPLMTPKSARDIGRAHLALAQAYELADMEEQAQAQLMRAQTWFSYSINLRMAGWDRDD